MEDLAHRSSEDALAPLNAEEAQLRMNDLPQWRLADEGRKITRHFCFPTYQECIEFVLKAARVAHDHGHYPVLHVDYTCIDVDLTTRELGGLTDNDLAMATHIDTLHFVHMATVGGEAPDYSAGTGGCGSGGG